MIRVRLKFDSTPVSYAQKCWFTFDGEKCRVVNDVAHLIASRFGLHHGIQLYMEDYLVPTNEAASVFRDNDTILVKTVPSVLSSSSSSSSSSEEESSSAAKRRRREPSAIKAGVGGSVQTSSAATPAVEKKLVGITKKLPSGGLHTKFCSSTSSSSGSSSSSSDSSSSSQESLAISKPPSKPATQWDVEKPGGVQKRRVPMKAAAAVLPARLNNALIKPFRNRRGRRGARRGKGAAVSGITGGPGDVLSTKSLVFTSPVGSVSNVKVMDVTANKNRKTSNRSNPSFEAVGREKEVAGGEGSAEGDEQARGAEAAGEREDAGSHAAKLAGQSALPVSTSDLECSTSAEPVKDYSCFTPLQGVPRIGDKLAFKTLELSSSYTPEVSEYMEASVVGLDQNAQTIKVRYSQDTLSRLSRKATKKGKFALQDEDGDETTPTTDLQEEIELSVSDMLETVLVT